MYQIKIRISHDPYYIYIDNVVLVTSTNEGLYVNYMEGDSIAWKFFSEFDYYTLTKKEGESQC